MDLRIGTVAVAEDPVGGVWHHCGPDGWEFRAYRSPEGLFDASVVEPPGRFAAHELSLPGREAAEAVLAAFADRA